MKDTILDKNYPAIIITVYHRIEHLKQCIESLEESEGAENYHLIIGSDAPFKESHTKKIDSVREYLQNKQESHGFAKLSVIYHQENKAQLENIDICNDFSQTNGHKSFILMEDDVIVGRHFLQFMTDGLNTYADNTDVIAINGYLDLDIKKPLQNAFLYNRFCAYGFGSWYNKWQQVIRDIDSTSYPEKVLKNPKLFQKIVNFSPNAKSYPFLANRLYRAWDIEIGLLLEVKKLWVLVPPVSLTANRGMDGSGLRSGRNPYLQKIKPNNGKIEVLDSTHIEKIEFQNLKNKINSKNIIFNWFSYAIYNYLPFGYQLLNLLRKTKKSI